MPDHGHVIDPNDWIDYGMFETKLHMRLQSGEPKCFNCRAWDPFVGAAHLGACRKIPDGERARTESGMPYQGGLPVTTDLDVCSAWEQK